MAESVDLWNDARNSLPDQIIRQLEGLCGTYPTLSATQCAQEIKDLLEQKEKDFQRRRASFTLKFRGKEWNFRQYFSRLVHWLNKHLDVGDAIVQFDPTHAALPWAAFRFIMHSIVAWQEQSESLLNLLESIPRLLHFGVVFELVYTSDTLPMDEAGSKQCLKHLRKGLTSLYARILKALAYCDGLLNKNKAVRRFIAVFNPTELSNILQQLFESETDLEKQARTADRLRNRSVSVTLLSHLQGVLSSASRTEKALEKLLVRTDEDERLKVLGKFSTIPYRAHHDEVSERRTKDTGKWILEKNEFKTWEEETASTILVLYGIPGAGKTYVVSKVIDHILNGREREDGLVPSGHAFAYFYCNRNDEIRRTPEKILQSFVRQLSSDTASVEKIHPIVKDLPNELEIGGAALTVRKCRDVLLTLVNSYISTTIVIDALDECDRDFRGELMDCLEFLLREGSRFKLLISSRPDGDITRQFQAQPVIQLQATDNENDISRYVQERLSRCSQWARLDVALQEEIKDRLQRGSNGMFQWVALQVQQLLRMRTWAEKNIRERLDHLPQDLKHAYDEIWAQLDDAPPFEKNIALRSLRWVMCSFEPLDTFELSLAVLLDPETEEEDNLKISLDENEIRDLCGNLLTLNEAINKWEFSHLSVREYLEKNHFSNVEANRFVAKACLKQLLTFPRPWTLDFFLHNTYLIKHWLEHVTKEDGVQDQDQARLKDMLKRFLGSWMTGSEAFHLWVWAWPNTEHTELQRRINPDYRDFGKRVQTVRTLDSADLPVHSTLAVFGIFNLASDWWADPDVDLDFCGYQGFSLLYLAVEGGNEALWRFLLRKKVNLENGCCPPLHKAIEKLNWEAFDALIEAGANVNAVDKICSRTALMTAASRGDQGIKFALRLLECGADINHETSCGDALKIAAESWPGHEMALMFLREGAESPFKGEIMKGAAKNRMHELLQICIQKGWDLDWNDENGSPLISAALWGNEVGARMLLKAGANVNLKAAGFHGTALIAAVTEVRDLSWNKGKSAVMSLLLEHGADINLGNGFETPLTQTIWGNYEVACFQLLEAGADVNTITYYPRSRTWMNTRIFSCSWPTPLCRAAGLGRVNTVRVLLEFGADPNLGYGRSIPLYEALIYIAETGAFRHWDNTNFVEIIEVLLEFGAGPRAWSGDGIGNLLVAVALHQQLEVCEMLLDKKLFAINEAFEGAFPNALYAAVAGQRLCFEAQIYEHFRRGYSGSFRITDGDFGPDYPEMWLSKHEDTERLPYFIEFLFREGAALPMPLYTGPTSLPFELLSKPHRFWALESIRGFLPSGESEQFRALPIDWVRVMWHFETIQRPHLPLRWLLQRCGLPRCLPRRMNLVVKFRCVSEPSSVVFMVWQLRGDHSTVHWSKRKRHAEKPGVTRKQLYTSAEPRETICSNKEYVKPDMLKITEQTSGSRTDEVVMPHGLQAFNVAHISGYWCIAVLVGVLAIFFWLFVFT